MAFKKVSIGVANDDVTPPAPKAWRNAILEHVTCVPKNPTMFHAVPTLEQHWNSGTNMEQLEYIAP